MTDPRLRDSAQNFAYYENEAGQRYENKLDRFKEERVLWAANRLKHAKRVLDVGAGDGFLAELLPETTEYFGLELNKVAVANAHPRAIGRIQVANAVTFDYASVAPFDAIVSMEILEHVPDPFALLRAFRKGLAEPNGFIVTTSATGHDEHKEPGNQEHLREWNPAQFQALHEHSGFYVVERVLLEVYRNEHGSRMTTGIMAVPK